jgi:hypothetical protein
MSKTTSKKNKQLVDDKILEKISGLIHRYHGRFLADDTLTDSDVLLLAIYLINRREDSYEANYLDVKNLFIMLGRKEKSNFGVAVNRAKKQKFIERTNAGLSLLIKGLKKIRELMGQLEKSSVHIIKSGQTFSAIKLFEEFLTSEITNREILLCDSYVAPGTIYPFSVLKGKISVLKILTSNIYEPSKLKSYIKKLAKETAIKVEIKTINVIHDRYLVNGKKVWSIGTSIKNLGNKDTMIREISDVYKSLKELFLERYNDPTSTLF